MPRGPVLMLCTLVFAAVAAAAPAAGEEPASGVPSLEYRPPHPVVPEPKAPRPAPPVTIFREQIGGFGISTGSFDAPVDVAFGAGGDLYVLDAGNQRVQRFDSFGNFVSAWGSSGSRAGEFRSPEAIAVDAEGAVYIADTGNHRVQKFDADGKFLLDWGGLGSRAGNLKSPRDLTVDKDGNVWVLDAGNERVQWFDDSGNPLGEWGGAFGSRGGDFGDLASIAWSDERFGYVYLLGPGCLVQQFELDGTFVGGWGAVAPERGTCEPGRIEADNREGYLYVVDAANSLFERFTRDGHFLAAIEGAVQPFDGPRGLCVNPERSDFAVADTGSNVVQKFTLR